MEETKTITITKDDFMHAMSEALAKQLDEMKESGMSGSTAMMIGLTSMTFAHDLEDALFGEYAEKEEESNGEE